MNCKNWVCKAPVPDGSIYCNDCIELEMEAWLDKVQNLEDDDEI